MGNKEEFYRRPMAGVNGPLSYSNNGSIDLSVSKPVASTLERISLEGVEKIRETEIKMIEWSYGLVINKIL